MHIELREHDRRISGLHRTLGRAVVDIGDHRTKINGLEIHLEDTRNDVTRIEETITKDREERRKEGADTRKALYTAAVMMLTFSLSIIGLIVTLLSNHG